jgi:aspartate/methionine/tyrosine aminotransferase
MRRFPKNDIISLVGAAPRYDLAESVGPDLRLGDLLDGDLDDLALAYGTAEGDARLRQAIADLHGVDAEDVVITVGGMHALFLLAFILCKTGDEAVTTAPLFPIARNVLDAVGAVVRVLNVDFDNGYQPDVDALARQLSPGTKLVSLATPQNPSGVAVPRRTLQAVLDVMRERCPYAYLVVDETYREAAYGNDAVAATALTLGPRVISTASLSKCHGAPGLRIGWAITRDTALRDELVRAKFGTVLSCSQVDEALALRVLERRDAILAVRRDRLAEGLARTAAWVAAHADLVEWVRPDAGALCCVRLKHAAFDDAAVARFYAAQAAHGVRVAKGTWFGEDARVFRLGFGLLAPDELSAGLDALGKALRQSVRAAA